MKHLIILVLVLVAVQVKAQVQLDPRNEVVEHKGLSVFAETLKNIIAQKDTSALYALLDNNIMNGFGGNGGIEEFKQYWPGSEGKKKLWYELGRLMALGGTLNRDHSTNEVIGATWPAIFDRFPESIDAFESLVVTGTDVALREGPDTEAAVIARFSYHVLTYDYEETRKIAKAQGRSILNASWYAIKYQNKLGYMSADYLRSPIDYRMNVLLIDGQWKITMLLAGD